MPRCWGWCSSVGSSRSWAARSACERQDGERAHALRAMDQDALDISCGGRAGVERGVVAVAELGPAVGVVKVHDDVGGIEQYDQVLREIGDSVDLKVGLAQQDRAGLRDGKRCANDGKIDIRQILRYAD